MTARAAYHRATLLLCAAVLFVVLSVLAMYVYSGGANVNPWSRGYAFWNNFLSDLGATRSWSGRPNHTAMILFSVGLATIGVALVAFSRCWRAFAFARSRARVAGLASEYTGALSGGAFAALACSPVDKVLDLHNSLVVAAFALLLLYVVSLTIVWAANGATPVELAASVAYVVVVIVYFAIVLYAVDLGIGTAEARRLLIGSQKLMAYGSMLFVVIFALLIRRRLRQSL